MKRLNKYLILFVIGGISYFFIEILWRGHSHITMFILGGLCFVSVGLINEYYFKLKKSLLIQQSVSCLVITTLEFKVEIKCLGL
jgi:asparagine N-glycosylation enzyme membrane subunit Stt3